MVVILPARAALQFYFLKNDIKRENEGTRYWGIKDPKSGKERPNRKKCPILTSAAKYNSQKQKPVEGDGGYGHRGKALRKMIEPSVVDIGTYLPFRSFLFPTFPFLTLPRRSFLTRFFPRDE